MQNFNKLISRFSLWLSNKAKGLIQLQFPNREVQANPLIICLPNAVMIFTADGNNVVITTDAARRLVQKLPEAIMASKAPLN